ncbi:MAG TPA: NAD(P)/FAD-dependent oxidoreductase [Bryobacteraceae bacterium]|nr:NAD(P)/FAD-dependent oxidoreductase [Bryobacteraceae bacterium]
MRRCDVLIVGGGPAGSSCARSLVESAFDVVVLDQARFPRDKTCGGWITPVVLQLLAIDCMEYAKTNVLQPITGFHVSCLGRSGVRIPFASIVSYGIRRFEFDDYLLKRCGAHVYDGTRVNQIQRDGRSWVINGSFSAPMLVGAGGHFCPVARMLGARVAAEPAVLAQQAEWQFRSPVDPAEPELLFFPDRRGYAWRLQKQDFINVGLGRLGPDSLAPYRRQFLDWLRIHGAPHSQPPAWHGHAYLTADASRRNVCDDGVLLVGDAAGLADPRSGEGIRQAVESGLMAAQCIAEARGECSRAELAPYALMLRARYSPRSLPWPVPGFVARGAMSVPWFVREVVVKRWFLHLNDHPLPITVGQVVQPADRLPIGPSTHKL